MPRVLLVEDETMLRSSMARAISKIPTYFVEDVTTVEEAIASIEMSPPDILVSDIDLPDRSGIELLSVLKKRKLDIPVLFVSAYLTDFRGDIPISSGIFLLEKPFEVEQLREKVRMALHDRTINPSKELTTPMSALGYVELASLGKHSIQVCIVDSDVFGEIVIKEGAIWAAQDWEGVGEEAFMRLIFQKRVTCVLYDRDLPRNVFQGQSILHLARLRQDEEETQVIATRQVESAAEVDISSHSKEDDETFSKLWDIAVDALLAKDYLEAELAFSQALQIRPEHPGARANVERLHELGYPMRRDNDELG